MINTNQSKLTPTLDRNTDKGGTMTWEQCKYPKKTQIISKLESWKNLGNNFAIKILY